MMVTGTIYKRVFCPECGIVQEMTVDKMPANKRNHSGAADIQCAECHFVIATVFE